MSQSLIVVIKSWLEIALDDIRTIRILREKADCKQSSANLQDFFFIFLAFRWDDDIRAAFIPKLVGKNCNKSFVNIVFIRGQHVLVIMFASICGFKSRAAMV